MVDASQFYFPYPNVRSGQDKFMSTVYETIEHNKTLLVSAPTGLGKTICSLAPTLTQAIRYNKKVVYLTSRQTQVNQVLETLNHINQKRIEAGKEKMRATAFIGKKNMCYTPISGEHPDPSIKCKRSKVPGKCAQCKNTKDQIEYEDLSVMLEDVNSIEEFITICRREGFCPYTVANLELKKSDIVVCDVNYVFVPTIAELFLSSFGVSLEDCIIIADEAHNLPDRIRNSHSHSISTQTIQFAKEELKQCQMDTTKQNLILNHLKKTLEILYSTKKEFNTQEYYLEKNEFLYQFESTLGEDAKPKQIIELLEEIEDHILQHEIKSTSWCGSIARSIQYAYDFETKNSVFTLEITQQKGVEHYSVSIKCLDIAKFIQPIFKEAFAGLIMSATLTPLTMYRDVMGIDHSELLELDSPFMAQRQKIIIDDEITTQYSQRSADMFRIIALHVEEYLNADDSKNALVFFPSYSFMQKVVDEMHLLKLNRRIIKEQRGLSQDDKNEIIAKFKHKGGVNHKSCVLFAVTSGSFSEGIDLPKEALEMVLVVGIPLGVPDLFTKALMRYYERKFRKGQLYGYVAPAISKITQAAGRCIRSEEDRGLVVLMDKRFLWTMYAMNFPSFWKLEKRTPDVKERIQAFFEDD
ncbi:MAG: ATP-dependent DNA helicase [Candidatus Nanoarchaeia archaeon]